MKKLFSFTILVNLILFTPALLLGSETIGSVVNFKGCVQVLREDAKKSLPVESVGFKLRNDDIISTGPDSHAWIQVHNDIRIIIMANSKLTLSDVKPLDMGLGQMIVNVARKIKKKVALRIRTLSAIIGVKGTQLYLNVADRDETLYLKKGNVSVEAREGEFWRYSESERADFNSFKEKQKKEAEDYQRKQQKAFNKYVQQQKKEYREYLKQFEMKAGEAYSISDNRLEKTTISSEIIDLFDHFESWPE